MYTADVLEHRKAVIVAPVQPALLPLLLLLLLPLPLAIIQVPLLSPTEICPLIMKILSSHQCIIKLSVYVSVFFLFKKVILTSVLQIFHPNRV
jgi:hypothetical protein